MIGNIKIKIKNSDIVVDFDICIIILLKDKHYPQYRVLVLIITVYIVSKNAYTKT